MYNSDSAEIENIEEYTKLNWDEYGKAYFYGCHIAQPNLLNIYHLQEFANRQGVVAFGSLYGTRFSSNSEKNVNIDPLGNMPQDVYLNSYGIPVADVITAYNEGDSVLLMLYLGSKKSSLKAFSPQ